MALSERSRHELYEFLRSTPIGEEATNEVLSHFPARDVEEPVSRADLRNETALIRLEVHAEVDGVRDQLRTEMGELRDQLRTEIGDVRSELGDFRQRVDDRFDLVRTEARQQLYWTIGTMITLFSLLSVLIVTTG